MNTILKIFLSMSFSGALLTLTLFWGNRFLKDKLSRQWQYYIWLIVILRLLFPFGPETSIMGKTYQAIDQKITRSSSLQQQQSPIHIPGDVFSEAADLEYDNENTTSPAEDLATAHPLQDIVSLPIKHIWLIWLSVALGILIRKVTIYQSFLRYIKSGLTPVSDMELLDRLSITAEQVKVKRPIELCVNPLVSSPLLIGFFHPYIVLPSTDISKKDFRYIVLHELTHYKRWDMFYKWLVQITVCLHWFNPFVYLMSREITKACEFSCDEAVLARTGHANAQEYGKTLLDAMAAVGKYKENPGAVTLSENKQLLKERLRAIMNFRKKSKAIRLLTGMLTLCMIFGAYFVGVYPVAAASDQVSSQAEQYYEADSLPLFQIAFSQMDEKDQLTWLEKLYTNGDLAFFSVALGTLGEDDPLIASFAEKAYGDGEIAFFSTLTDCMDKTELEPWLDRALEDGKWNFQAMLFDKLDMEDEKDTLEQKLEEKQMEEYQAAGVKKNGKNYYYQGQLVNIFLDIRPDQSFYTLDMNPAGTVNIKIIRGDDGQVTGAACMTEAEVTELLSDINDLDDDRENGQ